MTEKEYRELDAVNYSSLARLDVSPNLYKNYEEPEEISQAFLIGSAVDCFLTKPEEFDSIYIVLEKRTDTIGKIVEEVYDHATSVTEHIGTLDDYGQTIILIAAEMNWQSKWKIETKIRKVVEEGFAYFESLKLAGSRTILSTTEHDQVMNICNDLQMSESTKWIFDRTIKHCEALFQVPIVWEYSGMKCKALLDCVYINHDTKTIYPIDIKTTGSSVFNFADSFVKWRYYLQAAFYMNAIIDWRDVHYPEYGVNEFRFAVAEKACNNSPLMFIVSSKTLDAGEYGGFIDGKKIKGFRELIEDLKWHNTHDIWHTKPEYHITNGNTELNIFDKVNKLTV